MDGVAELIEAIALTALFSIPVGISLWALLDCARRPAWAWSLADRRQVVWIAAILMGFLTVIGGLMISSWYLVRVRPVIRNAEDGRFDRR